MPKGEKSLPGSPPHNEVMSVSCDGTVWAVLGYTAGGKEEEEAPEV